jgi:uncharacterized protein YbjT (DUF2867 family)
MNRVLLTGATGVLGTELRPRLRSAGHDVRAASRETDRREVSERAPGADSADGDSAVEWVELDLEAGTGIRTATDGVDVVVHAASDPRGDHEAVDVDGTRRLLDAAAALDVEHFLYVSIVGIDDIPYSYYEHKLEAERAVEDSRVPSTVVRSTQFFPFVASILATVRRLPVWPLPTDFRLQPVDVGEAADAIVEHVEPPAAGRAPDVGGPQVHTGRELAEAYREACGLRRPVVRLPLPGEAAAAFRTGAATCPDRAVGTRTWREWLDAQDGVPGADAY